MWQVPYAQEHYNYVLRGTNYKTTDSVLLYLHGRVIVTAVNNDFVTDRLGNYTGTATCAQNGPGSGVVTAVSGVANRIQFVDANGMSIYADLNCAAKTLNIPTQSIGGSVDAAGSGTFSNNTISFTLRYSGPVSDTCVYTLQK